MDSVKTSQIEVFVSKNPTRWPQPKEALNSAQKGLDWVLLGSLAMREGGFKRIAIGQQKENRG